MKHTNIFKVYPVSYVVNMRQAWFLTFFGGLLFLYFFLKKFEDVELYIIIISIIFVFQVINNIKKERARKKRVMGSLAIYEDRITISPDSASAPYKNIIICKNDVVSLIYKKHEQHLIIPESKETTFSLEITDQNQKRYDFFVHTNELNSVEDVFKNFRYPHNSSLKKMLLEHDSYASGFKWVRYYVYFLVAISIATLLLTLV